MKTVIKTMLTAPLLLLSASAAHALVAYNFAEMANTTPGERGFSTYTLFSTAPGETFTLDITGSETNPGNDGDPNTYAYLDSTSGGYIGGLGVCGKLSTNHQCVPSSDDNVTVDETLMFEFTGLAADDLLTVSIYVNNNHDNGLNSDAGEGPNSDKIEVNGTDVGIADTGKSNNAFAYLLGTFNVTAGNNALNLAYSNEQFYVSAMEIVKAPGGPGVPEPATLLLTSLGLFGIGYQRRRRSAN